MQLTPTRPCPPTLTFHYQAQTPSNTGYCSTIQFTAVNYSSAFSCLKCNFQSNKASYGTAVTAIKYTNSTMAIDLTGSKFSGERLQGLWRCRLTMGQGATRDTAAHAPSLAAGPPEAGGLGDAASQVQVEGCRPGELPQLKSLPPSPADLLPLPSLPLARVQATPTPAPS